MGWHNIGFAQHRYKINIIHLSRVCVSMTERKSSTDKNRHTTQLQYQCVMIVFGQSHSLSIIFMNSSRGIISYRINVHINLKYWYPIRSDIISFNISIESY